ncbi:hypothetical protein B0T26DRAFT_260300 [Lasiosphaeria miniovina]|uniref:Uncharacterized protein n=1 Tax=Lasiosphaeria miniovina TaxID=1954250 RepID=A0AA40E0H4_9PEZI|nr:uncharacterized protein B0T26DRAFT_260300 [Lasiosphaeria miniovina]KAK0723409.1 hypothetical protein B0T26DRAFT_260300 [Lasiosphaeria miniovina]
MHSPLLALLAVVAVAVTSVAAAPAPASQAPAQPACAAVPEAFWVCSSDCLYKQCPTGDTPCFEACDAECSASSPPLTPGGVSFVGCADSMGRKQRRSSSPTASRVSISGLQDLGARESLGLLLTAVTPSLRRKWRL